MENIPTNKILEERKAMKKGKLSLANVAGWATLSFGGLALIGSIFYSSQILAFIGLGLVFWGFILNYIQTEEYVKESLLNATTISLLSTLNQLITELGYKGKAIYLPPKYLKDPEDNKAFIPKNEILKLPTLEQEQEKDKLFIENPQGLLVTPPGSELSKLFEKILETSFTRVDIQYLQLNMPKLFIEDLEIAQNFEMIIENNLIKVKMEKTAYQNLIKASDKFANIHQILGCPLTSAIACALVKASGKPITIEKQELDKEDGTFEIEYHIMEEQT